MARVLLVEDDPELNWLLVEVLGRAGYTVTATGSAQQALAQARAEPFALAVVDGSLPDGEGLQLAACLRQESPQMAVVLLSAHFHAADETIQAALEEGLLAGCLGKPFHLRDLHRIIARTLAQRKEAGAGNEPHPGGG